MIQLEGVIESGEEKLMCICMDSLPKGGGVEERQLPFLNFLFTLNKGEKFK